MSFRKPLVLLALLVIATLSACADVTGPSTNGFCGITGGPDQCQGVTTQK